MADLSNGTSVFQTYTNLGVGVAELGDNKSAKTNGNGIAGRTVIVSIVGGGGNVSQAELDGTIQGVQLGESAAQSSAITGTADAFTVIGVAGTVASGTMYLALQGTGTVLTGAGDYFTGVTAAAVADFPGISG